MNPWSGLDTHPCQRGPNLSWGAPGTPQKVGKKIPKRVRHFWPILGCKCFSPAICAGLKIGHPDQDKNWSPRHCTGVGQWSLLSMVPQCTLLSRACGPDLGGGRIGNEQKRFGKSLRIKIQPNDFLPFWLTYPHFSTFFFGVFENPPYFSIHHSLYLSFIFSTINDIKQSYQAIILRNMLRSVTFRFLFLDICLETIVLLIILVMSHLFGFEMRFPMWCHVRFKRN